MTTLPCLPLPDPLRGAAAGSFAALTIVQRLPRILRQTIAENAWSPDVADRLHALLDEIPGAPLRLLADQAAPDWAAWRDLLTPYVGQDWLEAPWLVVEIGFYRRILEAVGYFLPGPNQGRDPFAGQKGLDAGLSAVAGAAALNRALADRQVPTALPRLLAQALWGNQADRSMFPGGSGQPAGHADSAQAAHTLVDDTGAAAALLLRANRPVARVDLLLDNAGLELAHDLLLADALLSGALARRVVLHAKRHPFFVSDALPRDVWALLLAFAGAEADDLQRVGRRLVAHLESGRLRLRADPFWTLPTSYWQVPPRLRSDLAHAALIISKGDANYRRWLGDRAWPFTTPVAAIMCYAPAPVLSLRTCKAPIAAGLTADQVARLDAADPDWVVSGQYGVIQLVNPAGA